jgi:hypothetical protein
LPGDGRRPCSDIPRLDKTFFSKGNDGLAAGEKANDHSFG